MSNTFCKSHRLSPQKLGVIEWERTTHASVPISHNLILKVRSCWPQSLSFNICIYLWSEWLIAESGKWVRLDFGDSTNQRLSHTLFRWLCYFVLFLSQTFLWLSPLRFNYPFLFLTPEILRHLNITHFMPHSRTPLFN